MVGVKELYALALANVVPLRLSVQFALCDAPMERLCESMEWS